ncbi:MAG: hypothetical protein Q8L81_10135 [Bacteroidota bacterium]|nr:hypothetical protein [Bacteroidota bacterium]
MAGGFKGVSPWDKDIKSYESKITRINIEKQQQLYHKRKLPNNIFQKVLWKLSLIFWEIKKNKLKGNYNDPSLGYEAKFYNKAKEIIQKEKSTIVIVSTGPFTYAELIPKLKADFPEVKFVIDYRDYWEDVFVWLNKAQIETEVKTQQNILNGINLVLSPNNEMQNYYSKKFSKPSYLLPHCIDADDIFEISQNKNSGKIKLLYGGAFYDDIGENIELIKEYTDKLKQHDPVDVEFYVSVKGYEKELAHPNIKRFDFIGSQDYFKKVLEADYVILILPPNRVNAMSSKFYELVAFRKPILYFGNEGDVSNFIIKNKLGFHITKDNVEAQVKASIQNTKDLLVPDLNYNISKHTFEYQTKELIKELEKL